ncbi:MAG TPA: hypothetical protein PKZ32_08275 [Candidatus Melainabacteria bacterium]|nr:hypothetical protein [Candidatus Melainabacteria bacterium]
MPEGKLIVYLLMFVSGLWIGFGRDWHDVWFGPNWFNGPSDFVRCVVSGSCIMFVVVGLSTIFPPETPPAPSYEESTPIKVSSKPKSVSSKSRPKSKKAHGHRQELHRVSI